MTARALEMCWVSRMPASRQDGLLKIVDASAGMATVGLVIIVVADLKMV